MRILAGEFKGRRLLPPPRGAETRPITGLAKKSLFDILSPVLEGATILDLYCGTGTLGLEAISRGASRCFFAERSAGAVERLTRNINALNAVDQCRIWRGDVERKLSSWLAQLNCLLDVIFVDPPYQMVREWDWRKVQGSLFRPLADKLSAEGLVVLRSSGDAEAPKELAGLAELRVKTYGGMTITIYSPSKKAADV